MTAGFESAVRGRADAAGVQVADAQLAQFRVFYELLARWTQRINLTSLPLEGYPRQSIDRLLIEPLLALRFFPSRLPRWIDLGSGSGSPALPLRIMLTGGSLAMVESRERKTAFLREAVRALHLDQTEVRSGRIEAFAAASPAGVADVITMRAVKPTDAVLHAAARFLKPGGRFLIFGSSALAESLSAVGASDTGFLLFETARLVEPEDRLILLSRR